MAGQFLFQSTLAEVVRKLRSTSRSEAEVIEQCIADTKKEITSTTQSVKVTAVLKAVYFSMLGYSAGYGAFNIIEVMADKLFANKRIGYMAACLTFTPRTEVLALMTALLKRDLASSNQYEVGLALYCIASVCTPDLARDTVLDVVNLLNHPRNYVRKKAVLGLYRIFFEYPESLRPTYVRLKEKLDNHSERCDNDPAVRGAVVCLLCELARRNPVNFLGLAVPFFSMLSTVHSNWTLIKIVKVFGYFAPLEPRLGKKLVVPLAELIHTTSAKSVQYECILAVANGMSKVPSLTKLAVEKMKLFVEDSDQNLKYLGLDAMSRIMRDNPKLLSDQRDVILACLKDVDTTIRRKALEVLCGLVNERNFLSTIDNMLEKCVRTPPDEDWSNRVIAAIIEVVQTDDYTFVQDFEWYTRILLEISLINLSTYQHGSLLQREFVTVLTRVNAVRQFGVHALSQLLTNRILLNCNPAQSTQWEVIKAAAFLCGEYPYWLEDKCRTCQWLLSDRIAALHPEAQVMCVAAVGKIAAYVHQPCVRHLMLSNGEEDLTLPEDPVTDDELRAVILPELSTTEDRACVDVLGDDATDSNNVGKGPHRYKGLHLFRYSIHPDVQERANLVFYHVSVDPEIGPRLYEKELLPVALGAQSAVEVPEGLDLDSPFCGDIPALLQSSDSEDDSENEGGDGGSAFDEAMERHRRREVARRSEVAAFYIRGTTLSREEPPAEVSLDSTRPSSIQSLDAPNVPRKTQMINRELSRPSNYVAMTYAQRRTKGEAEEEDEATRKFRNVDVTRALSECERLPETIPYAQLLQGHGVMPSGKGKEEEERVALADVSAAEAAGKEAFEPVVLLDERQLSVTAFAKPSRVRKDGMELALVLEVSNLASSSSLYGVALRIEHDSKNYTEKVVRLESDSSQGVNTEGRNKNTNNNESRGDENNNSKKNNNNNDDDDDNNNFNEKKSSHKGQEEQEKDGLMFIAKRIKGSMSVCKEATLRFSTELLVSLAEPLPLKLIYTRERKQASVKLLFPLHYPYFAKLPKEITSEEFMQTVLEVHLAGASVCTCFVAVDTSWVSLTLSLMHRKLRLRAIDVFKDAASFYGLLHARKSTVNAAHVAVLLREDVVDGQKGVSVLVKTKRSCLSELLVQDIASFLVQQESTLSR